MSQLNLFSPEDLEVITSIPYRVGMHISYTEDEDGDSDDEREMKAIERTINSYAQDLQPVSPFIKEVCAEILKNRSSWDKWGENVFSVDADCEKAIRILKPVIADSDLKAYIKMVLEIASNVARAYGEFGMEDEKPKGLMGFVKSLLGSNDDADQPVNVSAAEDDSITRIAKALKKYA